MRNKSDGGLGCVSRLLLAMGLRPAARPLRGRTPRIRQSRIPLCDGDARKVRGLNAHTDGVEPRADPRAELRRSLVEDFFELNEIEHRLQAPGNAFRLVAIGAHRGARQPVQRAIDLIRCLLYTSPSPRDGL